MKHQEHPVIEFKNVSKLFYKQEQATLKELIPALVRGKSAMDSFWALDKISLSVQKGEVIGIVGSNGSGKSTLLKLIAGVTNPTHGSITTHGRVVPLIELGAGFHAELSGRENIYLNGSILGMSRKEIDQKLNNIIAFAELKDFIDQPIKHYSSGMYLRLAFSVAVHLQPDIVLIDEILSVGDENFQRKSLNKIQEIIAQQVTVVIVSHSLDLLSTLCTRIIWVEKGKLRMDDRSSDVIAAYRQEMSGQFQEKKLKNGEQAALSDGLSSTKQNSHFKEWGNLEAKITNIVVTDEKGKAQDEFQADDTIKVTLRYDNPKKLHPLNVALSITRYDDVYVGGVTTQLDKFVIKDGSKTSGEVTLTITDLSLLEGQFYIRGALFGTLESDPYHFWHHSNTFKVLNIKRQSRGMLKFVHHWD
jgi:lipopolysaccharide transport system ATP-binding protein